MSVEFSSILAHAVLHTACHHVVTFSDKSGTTSNLCWDNIEVQPSIKAWASVYRACVALKKWLARNECFRWKAGTKFAAAKGKQKETKQTSQMYRRYRIENRYNFEVSRLFRHLWKRIALQKQWSRSTEKEWSISLSVFLPFSLNF